mmetsp:Transcript_27075/g.76475  ORF Transcript_27075/g.76475 Transcript_27075/m.76475 type:complete len:201 (-) Transcript_27075:40-642(-)
MYGRGPDWPAPNAAHEGARSRGKGGGGPSQAHEGTRFGGEGLAPPRDVQHPSEADHDQRIELERELEELQAESAHHQQVLGNLGEKIRSLQAQVERQRQRKPQRSCASCRAVTLQVDAAAQSLLGAAGHVARALLRDRDADRVELLDTVLQYVEPVKHLDPELEDLYSRAEASRTSNDAWPPAVHTLSSCPAYDFNSVGR